MINLEDVDLAGKNGKVVVPSTLQDRLVDTYHTLLQHPGMMLMEATIRHVFEWKEL